MTRTTETKVAASRALACLLLIVLSACSSPSPVDTATATSQSESGEEAIKSAVANYVKSIEDADTALAREVWADAPGISFITPRGHQRGWEEIRGNFYEKAMGGTFATRKLSVEDLSVAVYRDTGVVEFYWVFDATFRQDGSAIQTKGRETQVFHRDSEGTWKLVHVHYSPMPVTGERQGF